MSARSHVALDGEKRALRRGIGGAIVRALAMETKKKRLARPRRRQTQRPRGGRTRVTPVLTIDLHTIPALAARSNVATSPNAR